MRIFLTAFFISQAASAFWFDEEPLQTQSQNLLMEFGSAPQLSNKSHDTFVLTTWNIYKGGMDGLYQDLEQIIKTSDFVLMQEFLLNSEQQQQIQKLNDRHWAFAKSFQDGGEWTGVATVSRWQPSASVPVQSPGTEPFAGTPKMSLITKYPLLNGQELWLINVHGLNFDLSHGSFMEQMEALYELLKIHQGPMIWAGDFNTWADTRREFLLELAERLGLERAPLENPMGIMNATLDHIFYRGFESVVPTLVEEVTSSDHIPLRLEFVLKK